jgi:hypothetical protein
MTVTTEIKAAVGGLALETTWLEYLAALLVKIAGDTTNEMALLAPQGEVFKRARKSADALQDAGLRERTLEWLKRAEELQGERHRVIHSIALIDRPGDYGYHPKTGDLVPTQEIFDLAKEAQQHADEGNYLYLYEWQPAFGQQPANQL